ncbi:MAG TPA: geopeptide radical SAM maturase [Dissulfurispiraceae bacterium]|nr:geopeptide radical SAM maturase [Dissulfurispiraceae bacterium]
MILSKFSKIFPCEGKPGYQLLYSTKRASSLLVHESVIQSAQEGRIAGEEQQIMEKFGLLVSSIDEEVREILSIMDSMNRTARLFSAMVVLNLDCNLACTYCYEGAMKGRYFMSDETADALIGFLEREHIEQGRSIHLDFYGGEPLLSQGLIAKISGRLKSSAERRGLSYSFNLITNGTLLTRKAVESMLPLGLKGAKINLDGPRDVHDELRPFKSGAGSYDLIVRNMKETCDLIEIQIGGNYNRETYERLSDLLDQLIAEGIKPADISMVKFTPILKVSSEFATPESRGGCITIDEPWLIEASIFLREEILKRGFTTQKVQPSICMVEMENDLVVNHDGALYKCPAFLGLKDFEAGNLQTGIKGYGESHNLGYWKKEECLTCSYLPLCFGGCRYMKFLRDGRVDNVDCRKDYLDATLQAFIEQEIRYGLKSGTP